MLANSLESTALCVPEPEVHKTIFTGRGQQPANKQHSTSHVYKSCIYIYTCIYMYIPALSLRQNRKHCVYIYICTCTTYLLAHVLKALC